MCGLWERTYAVFVSVANDIFKQILIKSVTNPFPCGAIEKLRDIFIIAVLKHYFTHRRFQALASTSKLRCSYFDYTACGPCHIFTVPIRIGLALLVELRHYAQNVCAFNAVYTQMYVGSTSYFVEM